MEPKQAIHYNFFLLLLCSYYCYDQKTGIAFTGSYNFIKIEFGHAQISVPKINTPMSKTACINPCQHSGTEF